MPELPEVETYVRELEPELRGRSIVAAEVRWERTIAAPVAAEFQQAIIGERFTDAHRRGKYMLFQLESGKTLIVHLRMTGSLRIQPPDVEPDKHTHVVLPLDDGNVLHYQDSRKFGRIWLVDEPEQVLHKLGPEPLGDGFTSQALAESLQSRTASIKALLLNQNIVAGVGNIYADEALFHAGIHPGRSGGKLSMEEVTRLFHAIREVLAQGIEHKGSSLGASGVQNYVRPGGEQGSYQEQHKVYGRTGEPCYECGREIERMTLAQRSTHFCPSCQR